MEQPIVSIVIPACDPPADAFRRCMKSVLTQSFRQTEILLVDDGSSAQTAAEMDAWTQRDARVHVFHQPNGGVGSARNLGISRAQGKYISFVDADDAVTGLWLQKAVETAEQTGADIVYGRVRITSAVPEQAARSTPVHTLTYLRPELWRVQKMLLLIHGTPLPDLPYLDFGPYGKLYRAELVKKVKFPVGLPLAEDQVFNHAMLRQCSRVVLTDMMAYYYIMTPGSATHQRRANAVELLLRAMEQIRALLYDEPEVHNAYDYRLICTTMDGIQMAYFSGAGDPRPFPVQYREIKGIFMAVPLNAALERIQPDPAMNRKLWFKIWLVKAHIYMPLMLFWTLKLKCRQVQQKWMKK